jgi:hypothetical protein
MYLYGDYRVYRLAGVLFSEHIALRRRTWWCEPNKWRNLASYRGLVHRMSETHRLRSRMDPEERWHCCGQWQRCLSNKWNAREFVQRHGYAVPTLYWHGRFLAGLPFDALPSRYVIRPLLSSVGRGTYVMVDGRDILHEHNYTPKELRTQLLRSYGWLSRFPIMVEEFITDASATDGLPTEYKFYMFGSKVGAINVVRRTGKASRQTYYSEAWTPFPETMNTHLPDTGEIAPPDCLNALLAAAKRLGVAYGTFVRVDFYATKRGPVFSEFSTAPTNGHDYTPFAERYLGDLWDAEYPDRT